MANESKRDYWKAVGIVIAGVIIAVALGWVIHAVGQLLTAIGRR